MFSLKNKIIVFLLSVFALLPLSCSPGYLSPDKALDALRSAFIRHDAGVVRGILSENSIAKIASLRENLASLGDKQAESASQLYGLSAQELKSMSEEELLNMLIFWQKDIIFRGDSSIASVIESGNGAVVRLSNGNELDFVKEGLYWKFDLSRL